MPRIATALAGGLLAALSLTAVPGATPHAQAQPFPPGVSCSGTTCRNDTDQHYLIEAWQRCRIVGAYGTYEIPFNAVAPPHETLHVKGRECPPYRDTDKIGDIETTHYLPTERAGISYYKAVVYDPNAPKVRTGSAG